MRKATLIGTIIAAILVFGLMLVPIAGANNTAAPPLQATSEPTTAATEAATEAPTTAATEAATTAPAATAAATAAATTTAATATTAPGALPRTGGELGHGRHPARHRGAIYPGGRSSDVGIEPATRATVGAHRL